MSKPLSFLVALNSSFFPASTRCLLCRFRSSQQQLQSRDASTSSSPTTLSKHAGTPRVKTSPSTNNNNKDVTDPLTEAKGPKGEFTPKPLSRPLGLPYPPQPGQNTGIDNRTLRQRRDDFVDYEKHIVRRKELARQAAKPYFREWTNMRYHKGKTFISNNRLFKADKALYFPNISGRTLSPTAPIQDTTPILRGKVSVVSIFSSLWAERQAASFVSPLKNPTLHRVLKDAPKEAQRVEINFEDNVLKAWLIRLFMWRMRKNMPKEQHERYFLVRQKALTDSLREQIGMMNSKVGYVYLLDHECRIRWAGSSIAEEGELDSLNNGLRKLIDERRVWKGLNALSRNADGRS
ncbi:mitochondrial ATPase complex subunit ATP10 [Histoplasma capsulatum G186AR]|uniref:Mitochondrial ATPase complex subunit ATP10 n=1 Tax=Ajellomyces capsulatus (strain G186AR / H82 / ATCC MYA-2454 / RMSCC 2432) TaxID=447093 RepID=C0NJ92_AJECG|nr:mitochondrial ATPase complex subunit ATP10 [Histoplasma capsulatum G186AR]EEH07933.1 mitochondrial ATPase complex subunit ATP10 [Histoplasma capsulatum G186AR]